MFKPEYNAQMDAQAFDFVKSIVALSLGMSIGFIIVYAFSLNTLPDRIQLAWWRLFPPKAEIINMDLYSARDTRFLDINGDGLRGVDGTTARTTP
jgi:hypothetical protein